MSIANGVLTDLFARARAKDDRAMQEIARLVYLPLRKTARWVVAMNAKNTVQPTELINEALAELLKGEVFENAVNRKYYFKAASTATR